MPGAQPTICLNMIVRNEAHIVHEVLDSVAPFIDSWVIVDTGSDDGTQDKIRDHMAALGIPGELYERPWRDFGHNRSEALDLARGHGDYIWVIDADDLLVGTPDFSELTADVYQLHYGPGVSYWRRQLFKDGLPWRYIGVLHEYADCGGPCADERLDGDYYIESRRLGGRSQDPEKYFRDAEILLAEVQRDPDNPRSVFYLAQSYYDYGDFVNARRWYQRRTEMAGFDEEIYCSLMRVADTMARLDEPWPAVLDVYLRAWEFRPSRAEPLHAIAHRYRNDQRYQLGYLFAERAAAIPLPEDDVLFVNSAVYEWCALDEQAVCASWIGKHEEAFTLCRRLISRDDISDDDRRRIAANRDCSAGPLIEAAADYPSAVAQHLSAGGHEGDVTVTLIAGPGRDMTERTLNSFLNCCADSRLMEKTLIIDVGLRPDDRAALSASYPFIEFRPLPPNLELRQIRAQISGRFWFHLGMGWQFFAREDLITRLTAVLQSGPEVVQVGVNYEDADKLTGAAASGPSVRHAVRAGRYALTDAAVSGPAMFDCTRLDQVFAGEDGRRTTIADLGRRAAETGLHIATLDEVLCILQF